MVAEPEKKSKIRELVSDPKRQSSNINPEGLGLSNMVKFPNISAISLDPWVFKGTKSHNVV